MCARLIAPSPSLLIFYRRSFMPDAIASGTTTVFHYEGTPLAPRISVTRSYAFAG